VALALDLRSAAAIACAGLGLGLLSVSVARARGDDLALTFAALDWLVLAVAATLAGGADSWLLLLVPALCLVQLVPSRTGEWPYLLAGSLPLVMVLAVDDPTLGGDRAAGLAKVFVLVAGGAIAAWEMVRPRRRRPRAATVDALTGFYAAGRLRPMLAERMQEALVDHRPLSVVRLRLEHFDDTRAFLGPQRAEELVRAVARRAARRLGPDGLAFRAAPDAFVLCLPGAALTEARMLAADIARELSTTVIGGHRQTLAWGASSFPAVRTLDELLAEAEGRHRELVLEPAEPQDAAPAPGAAGLALAASE
jgi:GGDEF domain-containing protein